MKTILRSEDLSCPSCIAKIEKALSSTEGVESARVHFNTGRIEIEYDAEVVDSVKLIDVVRSTGYESKVSPF